MNNMHIGDLTHNPILNTLKVGWEIARIKIFSITTLAILFILLAYASTLFLYFTGLGKEDTFYGFKVSNILFLINLASSFFTHLLFFSVATYVGKIFINVNDVNELRSSIKRGGVVHFIFRRFPIAFGLMTALTLILVPIVLYLLDVRQLNIASFIFWILFSYFYFLVQYQMILSSGFIKGFFSILTLLDPRYLARAFTLRYIILYLFYLLIFILYYKLQEYLATLHLNYLESQELIVGINVLFMLFITVTLPIASILASYREGDQEHY